MKHTFVATGILAFFTAYTVHAQKVDSLPLKDTWQKRCKIDSMTDENDCAVFYLKSLGNNENVAIFLNLNVITVFQGDLYPHRTVYLRVDKNKHYKSSVYDVDAAAFPNERQQIIQEMKKGKSLLLRYSEWPSASSQDITIPLDGFKKVYDQTFGKTK
jgi:invasion protein IalB